MDIPAAGRGPAAGYRADMPRGGFRGAESRRVCRTAQVPKKTKFAQFMFAGGDNSDEGGEDSGWTKRVKDPRAQARNAATAKREAAARKKPRGGAPPKKKRRGAFAGESESSDDDDDDMNGFIKEDDEESTPRAGRAFAMPVVAACEERASQRREDQVETVFVSRRTRSPAGRATTSCRCRATTTRSPRTT